MLKLKNITKTFNPGTITEKKALQGVDLELDDGDFVCNKGCERIYIQSAYKMPDEEKMEQEKRSLKLVDDSFRKIIVVGEHTKTWSDEKGIQIVSIYDFLLNPSFTE